LIDGVDCRREAEWLVCRHFPVFSEWKLVVRCGGAPVRSFMRVLFRFERDVFHFADPFTHVPIWGDCLIILSIRGHQPSMCLCELLWTNKSFFMITEAGELIQKNIHCLSRLFSRVVIWLKRPSFEKRFFSLSI